MKQKVSTYINSIAVIMLTAMLFSCTNDYKQVQDIFADKNLPIGEATNINLVHTDSGRVTTKMKAPLLYDFSHRKEHPYNEFPEGILITSFKKNNDSTTVKGDYALIYSNTSISEIVGNVVVTNHADGAVLKTEQLLWDQKTRYIYTEQKFTLTQAGNTYKGVGFEAKDDLKKWIVNTLSGDVNLKNQ